MQNMWYDTGDHHCYTVDSVILHPTNDEAVGGLLLCFYYCLYDWGGKQYSYRHKSVLYDG